MRPTLKNFGLVAVTDTVILVVVWWALGSTSHDIIIGAVVVVFTNFGAWFRFGEWGRKWDEK